jgi:hypothetical protein
MDLLVAHMLGDFFFQNRWMALNKTKNIFVCLIHCAIYTLCVAIICGWYDWKLVTIFSTHLLIDFFRIAATWRKFYSRDNELPWMITADQSIHLLILWILNML